MDSEQKTLRLVLKAIIASSLLLIACKSNDLPQYQPENIDEYIDQLDAVTSNSIKETTLNLYSYVGIALFVSGIGTLAWTSRFKSGLYMLAGGAVLMASVWVFHSPWFNWVVGAVFGFIATDIIYIIYKKTKDYIKPPQV